MKFTLFSTDVDAVIHVVVVVVVVFGGQMIFIHSRVCVYQASGTGLHSISRLKHI